MEIIIGVNPDSYDDDGFALGSMLARSLGATPILTHIYPTAFDYTSMAHVDVEWQAFLRASATDLLAEAKERFCQRWEWEPDSVPTAMGGHRSSGRGLAEIAEEAHAAMVVIGSAPGGSIGRFHMGSTADKLLHYSPVPVACAPGGFAREEVTGFDRVVAAFQDEESAETVEAAAGFAVTMDVPLRLLSIALRHRMYGSALGADAEGAVLASLTDDLEQAQSAALGALDLSVETDAVIIRGDSVHNAMARLDWSGDELLVLGSASGGQLRRVFLGDTTYKLLRSTPVPAVVLPRRRGD